MFKKDEETKKDSVVTFQPGAIQLSEEMKKMYQEEMSSDMENVTPRLPQIKVIRETQQFKFDDETFGKEFVGVILDSNMTKAYWESVYSGESNPPDCASLDAIKPSQWTAESAISPMCANCKLNKFGTSTDKDGNPMRGKACRDLRRIHILLDGYRLPLRLTLTPSALKGYDEYISLLQTKGYPLLSVNTRFSLVKGDSGGFTVSIFHGEIDSFIADNQKDFNEKFSSLKKMKADFRLAMRGQEIVSDEYDTENVVTNDQPPAPDVPVPESAAASSDQSGLPF